MFKQKQGNVTNGKNQISDFPLIWSFTAMAALVATVAGKFDDRFTDSRVQVRKILVKCWPVTQRKGIIACEIAGNLFECFEGIAKNGIGIHSF